MHTHSDTFTVQVFSLKWNSFLQRPNDWNSLCCMLAQNKRQRERGEWVPSLLSAQYRAGEGERYWENEVVVRSKGADWGHQSWTRQRRRGPFDSSAINLTFSSYIIVLSTHTYSLLNMCLDTICKHAFTYRHAETKIFIRNIFRFQQKKKSSFFYYCVFSHNIMLNQKLYTTYIGLVCAFAL